MQALVDTHQVGGIVTLVARDGKMVDPQTFGYQDVDLKTPMGADSIFRIMSMSKPITSVAVMMFFEDGKLALTDPVSRFIPAFREMKVLTRGANGTEPTLQPARRQITIRDLLTHRSGLTYGFLDNGAVGNAYRQGGISDALTIVKCRSLKASTASRRHRSSASPARVALQPPHPTCSDVSWKWRRACRSTSSCRRGSSSTRCTWSTPPSRCRMQECHASRTSMRRMSRGGIRPMKDPEEAFGSTIFSPMTAFRSDKKKCFLRRRWTDLHRAGLRTLCADAGQRWRARRRPCPQPEDGGLMTTSHTLDSASREHHHR